MPLNEFYFTFYPFLISISGVYFTRKGGGEICNKAHKSYPSSLNLWQSNDTCVTDSHRISVCFCRLRIFTCPPSCCSHSLPKETFPIPCVCPTWLWVCCDWGLLLCLASFEIRLLRYVVRVTHSPSLLGNALLYLNWSVLLLLSIWVVRIRAYCDVAITLCAYSWWNSRLSLFSCVLSTSLGLSLSLPWV